MNKEKNINLIQQVYADFGARNLEGVLNALSDDIKWEPPFAPEIQFSKLRNGKSEVKEFVMDMVREVTFSKITPEEFYADKDAIIVKGFFEGKANNTGKSFESDWVHIWKLRDDKICNYQVFWNTNSVASALK